MNGKVVQVRRSPIILAILFVSVLIWTAILSQGAISLAKSNDAYISEVNDIELSEIGIDNPVGLSGSQGSDLQIITYDSGLTSTTFSTANLFGGSATGTLTVDGSDIEPINVIYDGKHDRLLLMESSGKKIDSLSTYKGKLKTSKGNTFDIGDLKLNAPQGLAVDQNSGVIFILDKSGRNIIKIIPNADGGMDGAVTELIDLSSIPLKTPHGLAIDPSSGNLFILDIANKALYEISQTAEVISIRDLSSFKLIDPQTMIIAPSLDQTDDEDETSLYIVDRQHNAKHTRSKASHNDQTREASILEMSLTQPMDIVATSMLPSLVNTIDTSKFVPPSPDPCGVEYIASSNSLMIVDSEVDEMTLWAGANLFQTTLTGTVLNTGSTLSFSPEPTGVAYIPSNQHYLITDDRWVARRVWEVATGSDGLIGTADDSITSLNVGNLGSNDPEGVAYDPGTNSIFVIDGVNREVYRIRPGPDGLFNGIGDITSHFDTLVYGVSDPEGIGFNPVNNHLYVGGTKVAEVTLDGELVQMIDVSAAHILHLGGLGIGASSADQNAMSLYIADRAVDNDDNPAENDGKISEFSLPTETSIPMVNIINPVNAAGCASGQSVSFLGSAVDAEDGSLSSQLVWTSSKDGQIGTGASFSTSSLTLGTHVITAEVTDSDGMHGVAQITIAVSQAPVVTITTPLEGAAYSTGYNIYFSGTAIDPEDGDISSTLVWRTSLARRIGTGSSFYNSALPLGSQVISATAIDSSGVTVAATVNISVVANTAPVVVITSPATNSNYTTGQSVTFSGTANDTEDGSLSGNLVWTSSKDGQIGAGSSISTSSLSVGTHTITASVNDSKGLTGSAQITVTISAANQAPVVTITSPNNGASYTAGQSINFSGTATDEDGTLSSNLVWTSSRDGQIGNGSSFSKSNLTVGTHTITASAVDSKGLTGSAQITITVSAANQAPVVTITSPNNGTSYTAGQSINFSGTATDEDGTLSSNLVWTSSRDGQIGTGSSFSKSNLSVGTHTITASVNDSKGLTGSAQITITISTANVITKQFRAGNDTFVSKLRPTLIYGSSTGLELVKTSSDTRISYLKFAVSGITGNVKSVKLKLRANRNAASGGSAYLVSNNYKGTTTAWIESKLTWNNAPQLPGSALSSVGSVTANTWVEYDVTAAVTGNGTYSFALASNSAQTAKYYSDEAQSSYRPILEIQTQ